MLHSTLFNYGSVHICKNSTKLGRITSQSKVENKMALYRTAAMIFTAMLDLEARRKAKEASKARRIKIRCPAETANTDETVLEYRPSAISWLILSLV